VASPWYQAPTLELSQGDFFDSFPSMYLGAPVSLARPVTVAGKRHLEEVQLEEKLALGEKDRFLGNGQLGRAVLLTHSCEIDKDERYRVVALVRDMSALADNQVAEIREGGRRRFFPLPGEPEFDFQESYIDFRRLTTVRGALLRKRKPFMTMTDALRASMAEAYIEYITRAEL